MASTTSRAELYFSCDVETDGPIPGIYSMLSIGMAVCGRDDDDGFEALDPDRATFYRELQPISERFEPEAVAVSGLDRARLAVEGAPPERAMGELVEWVREAAGERKPIFVAYPLGFDWSFAHYYFVRYAGGSPFGHAGHLDVKTLYAAKAGVPVGSVGKSSMPQHLLSTRPHTHNALDDAIEQGELLQNLMAWDGRRSPT
ncbi:MAG: 3'-5' exonuclease [Gaiellaceae bacterium]